MKARLTLAAMVVGVLGMALALRAQEQPPPRNLLPQLTPGAKSAADEIAKIRDDIRLREQILRSQYAEFESSLLKLKQRLERSSKQEDRDRAAVLAKVLEFSKDSGIGVQFEQLVQFLKDNQFKAVGDMKIALDKSNKLADDLREILNRLREDTKHAKLRDEIDLLKGLIKKIEAAILQQQIVQAQTDLGKTDPKELRGNQERVTNATAQIAKAMSGQGEQAKGDPKGGGKPGDDKGKTKDIGDDANKAQSKEAGADKSGKPADAKGEAGKGKEGGGDPKSGAKGGDSKEGGAKGSKGDGQGDSKENPGDKKDPGTKNAGEKSSLKEATAKGEDKQGDQKPGGEKSASKSGGDSKEAGAKGSPSAQGEKSDAKSGGKGSEGQQAEAKPGSQSQGQSQAKSGKQSGDQPPGQKGDPKQGNQDPKDNIANSKKQVQDAQEKMQQAEDKIAKKDNKPASNDQGDAINKLEQAKKKLEELLRQLREEELERLLAALENRCQKMLAMQLQVLAGTERVFRDVENNDDKKPTRQNQQDSIKLSDQEKDIVLEATKAIEMLEAEGSAVAFPEVFQQVREDMIHVQKRLEITDVGVVTQAIERDIIESLKEMIEALKKAKKELDDKKNPSQPKEGQPPPNADQKLLDQIAELKMIRSMQLRVNARTETYGKLYVPREGEQTADPMIRRELNNLSERQERITDVATRIAKGDNK
ncbi:MAG: hypothetical protein L0215_24020 [Gemmataceae bacterium]|nr:hypothetical protein [Gemmataceae bacterium]